ncbi:type II toxin-antitoxin system Phd/YefM family antitoxin [Ampullimonas aquatilis]|uniref:type II toxin-antitoxin system Phd/YefM family antitoxin n=1 Tax=Ampullimonas aquatilis TaxID=1341549 RepID=UPI003C7865B9
MPNTTISSRDFNQNTSGAKKATKKGPVFITDRGQPAHVLLSFEDYQKLSASTTNIVDMLAMPELKDIPFEPAKAGKLFKAADLS